MKTIDGQQQLTNKMIDGRVFGILVLLVSNGIGIGRYIKNVQLNHSEKPSKP